MTFLVILVVLWCVRRALARGSYLTRRLERPRFSFRRPRTIGERVAAEHNVPLWLANEVLSRVLYNTKHAAYCFHYARVSGKGSLWVADEVAAGRMPNQRVVDLATDMVHTTAQGGT